MTEFTESYKWIKYICYQLSQPQGLTKNPTLFLEWSE